MRTLILSDLHLGNGGDYDIFAGSESLPALLDRFVEQGLMIRSGKKYLSLAVLREPA